MAGLGIRPKRYRRARVGRAESTSATALRYGGIAIVGGLAMAFGSIEYDRHQARQARLASLPPGYVFSNCSEVRAKGLAPLQSWEPGYSPHMDRDSDGVACEPYPIQAID